MPPFDIHHHRPDHLLLLLLLLLLRQDIDFLPENVAGIFHHDPQVDRPAAYQHIAIVGCIE